MPRCEDFYKKWEKDPNWCEKLPQTVEAIDRYIELINELDAMGFPRKLAIKLLPEITGKLLFPYVGNERTKILNGICRLPRFQKITRAAIEYIIKNPDYLSVTDRDPKTGKIAGFIRNDAVNPVTLTRRKYGESEKADKTEHSYAPSRFTGDVYPGGHFGLTENGVSRKIQLIKSALTTPQKIILDETIAAGYADDYYSALCHILKLWKERLEAEKVAKEATAS